MNLDNMITDLQTRIDAAQRERIRAEAIRESAEQTASAARTQLEREFDVKTTQEAAAKLKQMHDDLAHIAERITAILDEAGA